MTVVLTAACNLRCSYCYQNAKHSSQMEPATLKAAIKLLRRSRRRKVELVFYGGEPLLEFALIRRAVERLERRPPSKARVDYAIITNGMLLGAEQIEFLDRHRFGIQLSFDGVPEAQALRGPGSFERIDSTLDYLRRHHPRILEDKLRVAITVLPDTACHLADSFEYLIDRGVQDIVLSPLSTHDPAWTPGRIEKLDADILRLYRSCLRYHRRTGLVPVRSFRRGRSGPTKRDRDKPRAMCGVGRAEHITVDVDGEVHGCATFAGSFQEFPEGSLLGRLESLSLGSVSSEGIAKAVANYSRVVRRAEIFSNKQDKYSSYGQCRDCCFLDSCRICPTSIGHIEGNLDPRRVPDFYCAFTLVTNSYRMRFPRQTDAMDVMTGRQLVPELMQELRAFVLAERGGRALR